MRKRVILAVLVAPFVMAADGDSGCSQPVPTNRQIELNIPDSILNCPTAPKNPGASATKRQTAEYLVKLYAAWEGCGGNLNTAKRIYRKWQAEVARSKRGK